MPYTYLIGWSNHNLYYYGVRYGKNCHPGDLWQSYFTSSKRVKKIRTQCGEPDVIDIRRIFESPEKARCWEHDVIRRARLIGNKKFLNCHDGGKAFMNKGGYSLPPRTEQHKTNHAESTKGFRHTELFKKNRSEAYTGKNNPNYGKVYTRDQRINILKGQGRYRPFVIEGRTYDLVSEAADILNIAPGTLKARLRSNSIKWDEWRYEDDKRIYKCNGNKGRKRPDLAERNKSVESRERSRQIMLRYHHAN